MGEKQYIVFAERTGCDDTGNYFYRILSSNDPEVVWGDNFEQTPAGIIPNLEPSPSTISNEYFLTARKKMFTAVESTWFSVQDCIDGIISLLFSGEGEQIVNIPFGMPMEQVMEYVGWIGGEIKEVEYKGNVNQEEDGEEES